MTGAISPDEQHDLSELLHDFGVRWQIQWGTMTGLGQPLEADPRPGYRRARGTPTIVTYTVAEMRARLKEEDAKHAPAEF